MWVELKLVFLRGEAVVIEKRVVDNQFVPSKNHSKFRSDRQTFIPVAGLAGNAVSSGTFAYVRAVHAATPSPNLNAPVSVSYPSSPFPRTGLLLVQLALVSRAI